jgi:hypothetical protein
MFQRIREIMMDNLFDRVDELARAVVDQSVDEIRASLSDGVRHMSVAEARGYVRARARRIVQKHAVVAVTDHGGLSAWTTQAVTTKALERATHRVVRQLLTIPQSQFSLRVAG